MEHRELCCRFCGSSALVASNLGYDGSIVEICEECGIGRTSPVPLAELADLYASDVYRDHGHRFVGIVERSLRSFRQRRFTHISRRGNRGRWLDVGCARGLVLATARDRGWETVGLELNDATAHHARNILGLDVRTGSIRDAGFEASSFDVVSFWHVLEHLPDPADALREAQRILKPGGLLVIALPNLNSLQAQWTGRHWFHLDLPYHLFHFPAEALQRFLSDLGLVVECRVDFSLEFGPFGVLQSLLNAMSPRRNVVYDALKTRSIRSRGLDPALVWNALLIPIMAPLALALAAVEAGLGRGGAIELYARKAE